MAKRIIVPTDFSENAFIAARYACKLAVSNNYAILLFHCYNSKTTLFDEQINAKEKITPLMKGDLLMKEWEDSLKTEFPEISLETKCTAGLITEILPKIAIEPSFSMIVMGSNGLEKTDSRMFGSTTSQIATKSHIPVIAIPYDIQGIELKKVAMLTNFKKDELDSLHDFKQLLFQPATLDIIHVYPISEVLESVEQKIENWMNEIKKIIPHSTINSILRPIDYSNEEQDTIPEVVNVIINDNQYDIVIVTKTRKSFFEKWFSRSISKEVILKLESTIFFDNN